MPHLNGVLETSLYVADLDRSARFYEKLFGFKRIVNDSRLCALEIRGRQVLLLFHEGATEAAQLPNGGGTIPGHGASGYMHVAFSIENADVEAWEKHLAQEGVPMESHVFWPHGGHSLYLRDPDGHSIELATRIWSFQR